MRLNHYEEVPDKMIRFSPDMICTVDRNGCFVKVSGACKSMTGFENHELEGRPFMDFVHPDDRESTQRASKDIYEGSKTTHFKNRYVTKGGQELPLIWSSYWSEEDGLYFCVARDGTEQKLAEEKLHQREKWYGILLENGTDMHALLDEKGHYLFVSRFVINVLGYDPDWFLNKSAFDFIHPDDIPETQASFLSALEGGKQIKTAEFRFRNAKGEWRWVESTVNNQLQNPLVKALVVSSRDVTERVLSKRKLLESEQQFRSLFEAHPDQIIFEDTEGKILDVNPVFLKFFKAERKDFINRSMYEFLPQDAIVLCDQKKREVLQGCRVNFELNLPCEGLESTVLEITKIPVAVNGKITGFYSIAKDITAVKKSHELIRQQAKKLSTVFESITDGFFMLDKNWILTYYNSEFKRLLQVKCDKIIGKNFWEIYPEEINGEFHKQYKYAIETGKAILFEAFCAKFNIWFQVKVYPSEEGLSIYFDDVTEKVKAKQELEKLSLVAAKTTNGVMILDAEGVTEWVNESFTQITGYHFSEVVGNPPDSFLQPEKRRRKKDNYIKEKLKQGKAFTDEVLVNKKNGEELWLSLDVTPVLNENAEVSRFIIIQTDSTFRKEAEKSQMELTNDLYRQNKDLQEFSYIVSHNLRAPVANAMGLSTILSSVNKDTPMFEESLGFLQASVYQLDTVLKDLNTILNIRDKRDVMVKEKVYLAEQCKEAVSHLQEEFQQCGGEVSLDIEENIVVSGDKAWLYSIFYSLLSNAIKYRSSRRSLKIKVKCFGTSGRGTIISVADNGSGFDMEKAGNNIFRLYKKFHHNSEGRGIGLFLTKTQIEAMGGHIEASSQPDEGARFLIYLK